MAFMSPKITAFSFKNGDSTFSSVMRSFFLIDPYTATKETGGISAEGKMRALNRITRCGSTTSMVGGPEGERSGEMRRAIPSVGSPGEAQRWYLPLDCREAHAWKAAREAPDGLNSPSAIIVGGLGKEHIARTTDEKRSKEI